MPETIIHYKIIQQTKLRNIFQIDKNLICLCVGITDKQFFIGKNNFSIFNINDDLQKNKTLCELYIDLNMTFYANLK